MNRFSVTETQFNTNGAIAHSSIDYGTDEAGALSHFHMALASGIASSLVAVTVTLNSFDEDGRGWSRSETVKGTGIYTLLVEEGGNEE